MENRSARTGVEYVRCFLAVPVPAPIRNAIRQQIASFCAEIPDQSAVRWVPRDQIHLTLRFFGSIPVVQLTELYHAIEGAVSEVKFFRLQTDGFGVFPPRGKPNVVWVGVTGEHDEVFQLQSRIDSATRLFGEPPHEKGFQPHLTVGRVKRLNAEMRRIITAMITAPEFAGAKWTVEGIDLMRSQLTREGAQYSVLHSFPLVP